MMHPLPQHYNIIKAVGTVMHLSYQSNLGDSTKITHFNLTKPHILLKIIQVVYWSEH